MKKNALIILVMAVFAASPIWAAEWSWDILDKSMGASWDVDEGSTTNKAWAHTKGGSAGSVATQTGNYVNIVKTVAGSSARYAWVRPAAALNELTTNTAYTIEVKARAGEIDKTTFPDTGSNFEASQICLRIGNENLATPIFLRYGDGTTGGSISTYANGSDAKPLNTSEWHVYRIVLQKNHTTYNVYLDDEKDPVFANVAKGTTGDQRGVYFGAESAHRVNIDVEYVKMGTGDMMANSNALLSSLSVSAGILVPEFNPNTTEYTCELFTADPNTITPSATAAASDLAQVAGLEAVDVSSGTAVSTITVTAGDGVTTKTYTINYVQTGNTDYTTLIVNNDFDYVAENVLWNDGTNENYPKYPGGETSTWDGSCFRPVKTSVTTIDTHAEFYGWQMSDWSYLFTNENGTTPSQSMGIGGGNATTHGTSCPWLAGNNTMTFPNDFAFYQTIDKDNISAGTYKVTCILGIASGHLTSQRIFANQNVQFFGKESDYETNKTAGEIYSYAGYSPAGENSGKALKVYVTLAESDSLKLGLRGGSYKGDGTLASTNNLPGWFKFDYFTLTKINPAVAADASLSGITLSLGSLEFSPETYVYNVILPEESTAVTPAAVSNVPDAVISGTEEVDLTSGSGTSTIVVTALDGTTQKTYTINYTTTTVTGLNNMDAKEVVSYDVINRQLSVRGTEAYT
ncbi:MAG: cadherin-like beta sandwich domain-containing protein, partial [Prevotellaceae bacterium]|nr:cadherin-like beta sandwich domain-containing protein [Prevotellaceae bacterium]